MDAVLVFVPVDRPEALRLARGERLEGLQAFSVNAALLDTLDLGPGDEEEAERGAVLLASVHGLARHGERIVLVARVPRSAIQHGDELHNGGVRVQALVVAQVVSWFADAPGQPLVATAATASHGLGLDEAWELDEVQQMLRGCDLLWHGAEELARLED